jgi:hypothetical protein
MLTIVTGASQNHSKSLKQFLGTLKNVQIPFQCYIYDLGLNEETLNSLNQLYPDFIYKSFDYSKYPEYFNININAGEYAWKPVIIEEVSKEVEGIIVWCDSGNKIIASLKNLYKIIETQGIYSPTSSGDIRKWTHPLTLEYFGINSCSLYLNKQNRNGACLGFDTGKIEVKEFIQKFSRLAQDKACIAPEGSSRTNHRQDQAVFTILYYQFFGERMTENRYISFSIHNDVD